MSRDIDAWEDILLKVNIERRSSRVVVAKHKFPSLLAFLAQKYPTSKQSPRKSLNSAQYSQLHHRKKRWNHHGSMSSTQYPQLARLLPQSPWTPRFAPPCLPHAHPARRVCCVYCTSLTGYIAIRCRDSRSHQIDYCFEVITIRS